MKLRPGHGLLAGAVAASAAFVVLSQMLTLHGVARLDRSTELAMFRALDSRVADVWARAVSAIGEDASVITASVGVAALALAKRRRLVALVMLGAMTFVLVESFVLKLVFARERPHLFDKFLRPTDYSFPSGHALEALGIWGVIAAVLVALYPRARWYVIAVAIPVIASIGLSRIYFGVHWPTDVLGGFLAAVPPLLASVAVLRVEGARLAARARTSSENARARARTSTES